MPRVTIYVPDDLKARMDEAGESVNWSGVAQRAFREQALSHVTRRNPDMSNVVERLRASKEACEEEDFNAGKTVGEKWAKEEAEYRDLTRIEELEESRQAGADLSANHIEKALDPDIDRDEWREFWERVSGDSSTPSPAFAEGFIAGAAAVWDEVADQL